MERSSFGIVADGPAEITKAVRLCAREGVDTIKLNISGDGFTRARARGEMTVMRESEVRLAVEIAHDHGCRVASHSRSGLSVTRALDCGVDVIYHCEAADESVLDRLEAGMLLLADRGFYGFDMWTRAAATGADLLWRVKSTLSPKHLETLEDGSWLAQIIPTSGTRRAHRTPLTVRVIDYTLDDGRDNPEQYRLLTTILDPTDATAQELALAYAQRWEIENTFDELKTHQRGPRAVLRSKSPPLVKQEIWGHLCCHFAIRTLMVDAARAGPHEPTRVSFIAALRIARRSLSHSAFSPLIATSRSPACGITPSQHYTAESTPHAGSAPTRAWSNAKS